MNGKWINGHFPKKSFARKGASSREAAKDSAKGAKISRTTRETAHAPKETSRSVRGHDAGAVEEGGASLSMDARVAALRAPKVESASGTLPAAAPSGVLPAGGRAAAGVTLVPLSEDERLIKLREALRARASALTTGSIAPARAPEPQSVSLDFRTGTKTTIFSDGTLVTETFDTGSLRGLAGAFPVAKSAPTESAAAPRPAP